VTTATSDWSHGRRSILEPSKRLKKVTL